jgi:hypothetical protein
MSKAAIERYTLLIDHNRRWLASLACSSDIGGDTALRRRLVANLDMSLTCLERHRDCLVADLAIRAPVPVPSSVAAS